MAPLYQQQVQSMPKVTYITPDGERIEVEVENGYSVMEGAINNNVEGIVAECGGACACATCHVHVVKGPDPALPEPSEEEADQLDTAFFVQDNSRLSCQLLVTPDMDGLAVRLVPGTRKSA